MLLHIPQRNFHKKTLHLLEDLIQNYTQKSSYILTVTMSGLLDKKERIMTMIFEICISWFKIFRSGEKNAILHSYSPPKTGKVRSKLTEYVL